MQEINFTNSKKAEKFFNKHYKPYLKNLQQYISSTITNFMQPFNVKQATLTKILQQFTNSTIDFNTHLGKELRPYFAYVTLYAALKFLAKNTMKHPINLSKLYEYPLPNILGTYLELIHNHLLIHDDFMDKSIKRRGDDTVWYSIFKQIHNKHTSNSLAVLSGNSTLLSAINKLLTIKSLPSQNIIKALKASTQIINNVIYGQVLDIGIEKVPVQNLELDDIITIYKNKTAIYTNIFPVKLIIELFNLSKHWQHLKTLYSILLNLGIIFQLLDDLKDLTKSGKTQFLDIIDKKRTILVFHTLKNISRPQTRKIFIDFYNKKTQIPPNKIANIIKQYGIKPSVNYIKQLWQENLKIYEKMLSHSPERFIAEQQMFLIAYYYNKILANL